MSSEIEQLKAEIERITKERDEEEKKGFQWHQMYKKANAEWDYARSQLQHLREELEQMKKERIDVLHVGKVTKELSSIRSELEQRTNERNEAAAHAIGWKVEAESLHSELAAKDKVLETLEAWARNDVAIRIGKGQHVGMPRFTNIRDAEWLCSILSQYKDK